jgi:uroporphyrinogen-III synthase
MRVLVTRPLEDAKATADQLKALGHEALVSPLLKVVPYDGPPLDLSGVQAILVTSANGARALAARTGERNIPIFAVGPQTAAEAQRQGFTNIRSGNRDAMALAESVSQWTSPDKGALVHASGTDGAGRLAGQLAAKGFTVRTETLYAVADQLLSAEALVALANRAVQAVMLYSPRSARIFREAIITAGLGEAAGTLTAICISPAAAEALSPLAFADIRVAALPNQDALLACLPRQEIR